MTFNKSKQPKWSVVKEEDENNMKTKAPEFESNYNNNNKNNNDNNKSKGKEVCTHGQEESQCLVQSNSLVGSVQGTSQNLNTREEGKVATGKQDMQKIVSDSNKIQVCNKELKLDLQTVCVSNKSNKSTIGTDSSSSVEYNRCNSKTKANKGNVHVLVTSSPLVSAIEEWRRSIESNNYHAEQSKNEYSSRVVQLPEEEKESLLERGLEKEIHVKEEEKEQNGQEQQREHHTVELSSLQTLRLIEPVAPLFELLSPLSDRETIISSDTVPTAKLEEMTNVVDNNAHRTGVEELTFNDANHHKDRHKISQAKNDSKKSNGKDAKSTQFVFSPVHAIESNSLLTTTGTNLWSCMSAMNGDDSLSATSMPIFYSSNSITAHFITPQGLCFDSESNANLHCKHDNGVDASKNNDKYSGDDDETIALDKRDEESTYSRLFSSEASEDVMRTLTRGLALGGFDLSTIVSHELRSALTSGTSCTPGNEKLAVTELKTNSNGESLTLQRHYGINTCNRQVQHEKEQIPVQVPEHHVPEDQHELWEHEESLPPPSPEEQQYSGDKEKVCDHDGACDSCGYLLEANEGLSNQPMELESTPTTTSSSLLSSCHTIRSVNSEGTHTPSLPHMQRHGECPRHHCSPSIISNPPVVIVTAAQTPPTSATVVCNGRPQPLLPVQLSVAQSHVPYWNRGPHYHLYLHRFDNSTPNPHTVNTTSTTSDCLHENDSGDDVNDEPPENLPIERNTRQEVCFTPPHEHSNHPWDDTHTNANSNNRNTSNEHFRLEELPLPTSACVLASSAASSPLFLSRRHSGSPIHPHLRSHFALSSLTPHYRTESQLTVREAPVTIHECWAPEYPALELPLLQECPKECETAINDAAPTHNNDDDDNNEKCSEAENFTPSLCVEHHCTVTTTTTVGNESSSRTPEDHVEKEQMEAMEAVEHVGKESNNINSNKLENCNSEESVKVSQRVNNDRESQTHKDCDDDDDDDEISIVKPDDSNELAAELAESRDCVRMELPVTVSITNDEEPSSTTITQNAATVTSTTTTTTRTTTTITSSTTRSVTSITATCANISRTISATVHNGNNISDTTISSNNNYNNGESNTNINNNTTTTNTSRSASGNNVNSVITNRSLTALIGFAHAHRRRQNEFHSVLNGSHTAITNSSSSNNTTSTTFTASRSLSSNNNNNVGVWHDHHGHHIRRAVAPSASLLLSSSSTSTAMQRSSANAYVSGSSLPSSLIGENFLSSLIGTEVGPNAVLVSSSRCGIPQMTNVPAFDGAHLATSSIRATEETPLQQFPSLLEEHLQPENTCNSEHHMPYVARSTRNNHTRRHENNAPIITFPFYDIHEEQLECTHEPELRMSEETGEATEQIQCKDNNNINAIEAESNNVATNTTTTVSLSVENASNKHELEDDDDEEMHHKNTSLEQNDAEGKAFHSQYKSTNFEVVSGTSYKENCNTNNIVELLPEQSCNTNETPTIEQKNDTDAKLCATIAQTTLVDVIDRSKSECHELFHDSNNVGDEVVAPTASTTEPLHYTSTCTHDSREKITQNTSIIKTQAAASLVDVNAHSSITSFDGTAEEE